MCLLLMWMCVSFPSLLVSLSGFPHCSSNCDLKLYQLLEIFIMIEHVIVSVNVALGI